VANHCAFANGMAGNTWSPTSEFSDATATRTLASEITLRGIKMRSIRYCIILTVLVGPVLGCGSSGDDVPRTKEGLVPLPERPGPSQAEQKAAYLKRSKAQGRPKG
jgi:hypothetical protein